jgi:hypothetical protein
VPAQQLPVPLRWPPAAFVLLLIPTSRCKVTQRR